MDNIKKQFSKIYDKYVEQVYRFIFLKVNSQETAEDLCSEVFLRGWEAYQRFNNPHPNNEKIENIQAFLYQIARNLIVDHYRDKGRTQVISADYVEMSDPKPSLEEKAIFDSDFNTIRLALAKIKDDYQTVIICHYLDELSILEIAKMLGRTEGAVRVMLHRGLKALRNELSQVV